MPTTTKLPAKTTDVQPQEIIRTLLAQPIVTNTRQEMTPVRERQIAMLERQAPMLIEQAHAADAAVQYLGVNPLFAEARLYRGIGTDWVLAPATKPDDLVVPRKERQTLERLKKAEINFPLIYVAHEVEKEKTKELVPLEGKSHVVLDHDEASELVGPVPAPAGALELGDRLAQHSTQVLRTIARVAPIAGKVALGVVAAPVVLVGGALAGLATLDPIVLGAIPAFAAEPGEPAAWYVLARWEW